MAGYVIGIILGSIVISIFLYFFIKDLWIKKSRRSLVKDIGRTAEDKINSDISTWSKHTGNKFIPASIYKYDDSKVFEVDSILITKQAIIVVEIKSIKGDIVGTATSEHWTKVTHGGRYNITNAIKQNDKHISHVVSMTNFKLPIISLIIFSNRTGAINIEGIPSHTLITKHVELFATLDKMTTALPTRLTELETREVYKTIASFRTTNKDDIALHERITQGGLSWK